jgi:hypothetical protein
MRLTPLVISVFASILVFGCAGHAVDCAAGAGHNGCVPGTKEYDLMVENQKDAKTLAEIDDTLCRSYGAQPGSPAYIECRRKAAADRELFEPPHASSK